MTWVIPGPRNEYDCNFKALSFPFFKLCTYVCICICVSVQRQVVTAACPFQLSPLYLSWQDLSLYLELTDWLDWLASKTLGSACLHNLELGGGCYTTVSSFYVGAGSQNSGSHTCTVSTLFSEPYPQISERFFKATFKMFIYFYLIQWTFPLHVCLCTVYMQCSQMLTSPLELVVSCHVGVGGWT